MGAQRFYGDWLLCVFEHPVRWTLRETDFGAGPLDELHGHQRSAGADLLLCGDFSEFAEPRKFLFRASLGGHSVE